MNRGRAIFVLVLAISWLLALSFRLYELMIQRHEELAGRAEEQQQRVVTLGAPRGTIFDRTGRELAVSIEVRSVAAHPHAVQRGGDPEEVAAALAGPLRLDPGERDALAERLASTRKFVWVARKVDPPITAAIRELDLPGIAFLPESRRYYPLRQLAAPVLGYVGTDNEGLAGLEFLYDRMVATEPGRRTVVRDGLRETVRTPRSEVAAPRPGSDLHLTLDATVQAIVERALEEAVARTAAKRGSVIVQDPRDGAILAMASYPTFDPNAFAAAPPEDQRNRPVMDAYEPGSTFKMVTAAAALEAQSFDPLEQIDCGMGGITLDRTRINDHKPFGLLTTREIITYSSNVGAIKLGLAAGRQRLYDTIAAFGFGRPTGIDLPSESAGILRPLERWSRLTPAYVSFGHGVSVTALQLNNAFAAVANGGRLYRPHVVRAITNGDERLRRERRPPEVLPVAPSTLREVRAMLESVVVEGTAKLAAIGGYRAAGKTGTAQIPVKGGYARDRYIASFAGFAPLTDPRVVATVVLDEPWPAYHGGQAAAPVFPEIVGQVLLHLGVPPSRDYRSRRRVEPPPKPPSTIKAPSAVLLAAAPATPSAAATAEAWADGTVPQLAGLPARRAIARAAAVGLRPSLHGNGTVRSQSPAAGTPLELAGDRLELWLEPGSITVAAVTPEVSRR